LSQALQATDLLLRDGNLPLVVADLQLIPEQELMSQPGSVWFRLRSLAERNSIALLLITPRPCVQAADQRVELNWQVTLQDMDGSLEGLLRGPVAFRHLTERGLWKPQDAVQERRRTA
jgi:hypothetical protein